MEKSQINMVSWYKNDILIEETSLKNIKIDLEHMRLVINSLSHKNDNGLYHCMIELKNTQNVSSDKLKIETICKQ
jgi:hypothetical protein